MKYIHPPAVVSLSAPAILGENGFCHLGMVIMINHDWMSLITIKLINLKQASDSSDEKFCPSLCIIYLEMITITWSLIRYIIKRCYTGFISDFHCVFTLTLCLINVPFNQQSLVLNISVSTQYLFTAFCIHLPFTLLTFWSYVFDIESHDRALQVVALAAVLQLFGAESLQCSTEQKRLTRVTKESNRKKKKPSS